MPSLKDLRNRIESVKSTRKITKAMQMVAAARLRRAQEAAEATRPYSSAFSHVLEALARAAENSSDAPALLRGTGSEQTHLIVVMTSERGLCGGFNSSIVKKVRIFVQKLMDEGKDVKILTIGKKGREQLKRDYEQLFIAHVDLSEIKKIGFANAYDISGDIIARFDMGEFDVATLFFNHFESVVNQIPTAQRLIPFGNNLNDVENAEKKTEDAPATAYDYESSSEEVLSALLPRAVATRIFTALMENGASEQGARMSAMDNATRNAGDMIDKLTIQFNRSRQAVITNELIEIISGAEAL